MTYFGFGLADGMFPSACVIARREMDPRTEQMAIESATPCLNPSHAETIRAARERYGLDLTIPARAPIVRLAVGDSLIVMGVSGLPRLEGRHEYTHDEIEAAQFRFGHYFVTAP